jgi:hypothetical protein
MKNWFNRLKGGSDGAAPVVSDDAAGLAGTDAAADIDAAYYRWLTASAGYAAPFDTEARILDAVSQR